MTLLTAGLSTKSDVIARAASWLMSPAVRDHNNSYWLLGPLARVPGVDVGILSRELRRLEEIIRTGAKPHPNQVVEAFYLRALACTSLPGDEATREKALHDIKSAFDPETGWSGRADSTTDGYSVLFEITPDHAKSIRDDVIRFLQRHAHVHGDRLSWGSEVSTAYSVMNIVASDLSDSDEVRKLVGMAVRWLEGRRVDDVSWSSEPPFGGVGDLKSREYPTAAVVRALLAAASLDDADYQVSLADQRATWALVRARRQRKWLVLSFFALLVLVATPIDELVFTSLSVVPKIIGLLGIPLSLLGIYITLNPDDAKYIWIATRRRLRVSWTGLRR